MKKLHKKIISGALIGCMSMGVFLSQGVRVFAYSDDDYSNKPIEVPNDEKKFSEPYMKNFLSEHFYISFKKLEDEVPVGGYFRNAGGFAQFIYDNGAFEGKVDCYWIGGDYYQVKFNKNLKPVEVWNQWEDGLPRFFDYLYEQIKDINVKN